jgi:very-short-patch-repair endonuclease
MNGRKGSIDVERVILDLAARQHGAVARRQLLEAGVAPDIVDRRLKAGRLRPVHRGVYEIPALASTNTPAMAAVLACGNGAVVSHWSAAALWRLHAGRDRSEPVEVSVCRGDHSRRPGIRVHRVGALLSDEITEVERIPITTVARTLYDCAAEAPQRDLERIVAQALSSGLTDEAGLLALWLRCANRAGARRLRAILDSQPQLAWTRSEAEERLLSLLRKAQMPIPATNVAVRGYRVDFFWRAERFIVEIDGFAFHSSARMFENDRRRDADLAAAGLRVVRVTWRQLVHEPEALLVRLALALARADAREAT